MTNCTRTSQKCASLLSRISEKGLEESQIQCSDSSRSSQMSERETRMTNPGQVTRLSQSIIKCSRTSSEREQGLPRKVPLWMRICDEWRKEQDPPTTTSKRRREYDSDGNQPAKRPFNEDLFAYGKDITEDLSSDRARTLAIAGKLPLRSSTLQVTSPRDSNSRPDFLSALWGEVIANIVARIGGAPVSSRNKRGKGWLLPLDLERVTARWLTV